MVGLENQARAGIAPEHWAAGAAFPVSSAMIESAAEAHIPHWDAIPSSILRSDRVHAPVRTHRRTSTSETGLQIQTYMRMGLVNGNNYH
jgi:hypothetical protein